jgi:outer membrane protein OmpA-like peptidoglycan-associated protein
MIQSHSLSQKIVVIIFAVFSATACTSPGKKTAIGAGVGAAAGAGLGAIIGNQTGNSGKGALWGAAAGAVLGGAIGNRLDKQAKELEALAETKRTENGIVTKLKGDILFDSGSATLKPAAATNLNQIAAIIKKYPEDRVLFVGHTDSTGKATKNQTLSEQRAKTVMDHMAAQGLPAGTLAFQGMGPSQPVASNDTPDGRSRNRRVELQITVDESKVK